MKALNRPTVIEELGPEVKLGVQDGFSNLDVSVRTKEVFNGASRFADSVCIGVLSASIDRL